jgi:hypothetical protein
VTPGLVPETDEHRREVSAEAARIVEATAAAGATVRLLGGLAVCLHGHDGLPAPLKRSYEDIDLMAERHSQSAIETAMVGLGYRPDMHFNAAHGDQRLLFLNPESRRHIDFFVGRFELCHRIPLEERITVDEVTVPLAELLLTKLQIVQLNEKDSRDILALLYDHEVGDSDGEVVNAGRVAELCAADWGLWRTCTENLAKAESAVQGYGLQPEECERLRARLASLRERIEATPKTRKWKMRARVGERVRWYEEPEEELSI